MMMPSSIGPDYARQFQSLFPEIAERNGGVLIPFLLEGVAGIPHLNLPDGIHPTPKGHEIVARNVWEVLQPLLTE
jgi:acyl-CoA thioesterase-1